MDKYENGVNGPIEEVTREMIIQTVSSFRFVGPIREALVFEFPEMGSDGGRWESMSTRTDLSWKMLRTTLA